MADSNASLFDIITDFASGSDKIDLTALGALAFLALTSTSTSVPPHTIAWIYDGTINQTIVYVNPTDQTLSIGSSSLLEIHLQGIVTVASSDFVFEAAAAPAALAGEPINLDLAAATADATVFAMTSADGTVDRADATTKITDASFAFDADRDRFDFGHVRFAKFDEARTQPTEETEDNAVITPENGPLIVPHHVHVAEPAENKLAADPAPVLNSANTMTAHDDPMMHANGNIHSAGIAAPDAPGDMAALQPGNHGLTVANSVAHSGGPPAHGGNHSSSGDAGEHGNAAALGAPEPPSPAHGVGPAATGPPGHGDSFHFQHAIVDSGSSGIIEPPDIGHTPASIGQHAHAARDGGPDQAQTIDLSPPGHSADHLPSQAGHTHVAHAPHDIMV